MAFESEVKLSKTIAIERISSTLEDDGLRTEFVDNCLDDRLEEIQIRLIIDPIVQRDVQTVIFAIMESNFLAAKIGDEDQTKRKQMEKKREREEEIKHVSSSREEEIAIFVERNRHNTIAEIKRILDTIAVMDINVDVQDPGVIPVDGLIAGECG